MFSVAVSVRISDRQGNVEADDGELDVQTHTEARIHGNLVVEGVEVKFATWQ